MRRSGFATRSAADSQLNEAKALLALAGDDNDVAVQIATLLLGIKPGRPLPDRNVLARRIGAGIAAASDTTVGDYLDNWLAARRGLAESTRRGYGSHITQHLRPHLGHIPIGRLRNTHLRGMFDAIGDRNVAIETARQNDNPETRAHVTGMRTVGPAAMHRIRATLRKALNDAIRDRLIDFNPATHLELPSGRSPKPRVWTPRAVEHWRATGQQPSPVMVWTPAQAGQFLDYAEDNDPDLYAMFLLILHRGLRRGEAVGLPDANIDLDTATVVVAQQITTCGHTPITKDIKGNANHRLFRLDTSTQAAMRTYQTRRARWQANAGPNWPATGLYFVQPDGRPWHPQTISKRFKKLAAATDLPPIRLHDLRHGAATYLKAAGGDLKDIQELLGHSSLTITSDTYTSIIIDLATERAKAQAAADLVPRHRLAS
ncbi:tyrosine-type recombinase/integrase [Plantactinospora endophytica]|uniref:tyrosine-type recombinase/integrase n=1 Tax=Plantactinospora endophytica TaxID=673535 RepID=UPI003634A46A